MTLDLQNEVRAKAQARPEGFQKLLLLSLTADLVEPQEKVPAHGLFDFFLHAAEGLHGGPVFRVRRRSRAFGAEEMQVNMFDKGLFGQRLREIREDRGMSRKEMADLLEVSKTQISDIENGKSGTNLDRFYVLCEYNQVSADYLLGITDDPTWRGGPV